MDLFPHNKEAYKSAVSLFDQENRVCIIQPTGTGKSVIIAEFVNQNPAKRHLLLAPGSHIFHEIQKHILKGKIYSSTYIGLKLKKALFEPDSFDYIYLDEFHRLGAEVWGGAVERLLGLNPHAKVLGTSATPIRYLDDNRNMASEVFNDCIATHMSLNSAIVNGILPPPIYVSALYSLREEFQRMKKKILSSSQKDKDMLVSDLDSKVIDWERSSGLDTVLKKHLRSERRRVIVFCKDWEHLQHAHKILNPIFRTIYGQVESLSLYSKMKGSENESTLQLFSGDDQRALILYTIDKVNEGLHTNNCNTVILLRGTVSPIVFYQQIGRAFSVKGANRPLIVDLVNNFKNVQLASFKKDFEHEWMASTRENQTANEVKIKAAIEFIDEIQDIRQVFSTFEDRIDRWSSFYKKAKSYFIENGHLSVPAANKELYYWIQNQLRSYWSGWMSEEHYALLKGIGLDFTTKIPAKWMMMLGKLEAWISEKGELPTIRKDKKLATWIVRQRKMFSQGKLLKEQIDILGRLFPLEGDRTWLKIRARIDRLIEHFKEGTVDTADRQIRLYLTSVKDLYNKNRLPQAVLAELRAGHVPVEISLNDLVWLDNVKAVVMWHGQHGKLPLMKDNKALYRFWVREEKYITQTHPYERFIKMDKDAATLLEKLQDIISALRRSIWDERCNELKQTLAQYGCVNTGNCNPKAIDWMRRQRKSIRDGKLSPEKLKKLLEIKEIDWYSPRKTQKALANPAKSLVTD
ncbi:MAG TPA: Helicase associated domain protein [Puia sp.]|nr:Helicase associated domain protein [Puia sp.]